MVIESRYWCADLAAYSKAFKPVKKPPRWSERLVVNFEKDVTLALLMVRRLAEAGRFSSKMKKHKVRICRCAFHGRPHRLIFKDIDELYNLAVKENVSRDVIFICNQFIHADFTFAYRREDRNWDGLYTSSDFERRRWVYKVPIAEIRSILELAVLDAPSRVSWRCDPEQEDWVVETD